MNNFRVLLATIFIVLSTYTAAVISDHGMNLIPIFFGEIMEMTWSGQFNMDFMFFLMLSATWVSWREDFSVRGFFLGTLAFFGGALFLSVYLLVESFKVKGNIQVLLLGRQRATQHGRTL
ncbi:hypothetical protein ACQKQC_20220 [Vibrio fortis]|uniref:Uncharacterized protein n=1 Tax=Vibrio pelagius TaxID=28169 RepID=A0ABY5GC90_VIBPE|nr:hypothetical protein [Vibrio pelagius]UTT87254.1 hypothetical protein LZI70_19730 [Vibrio pelagius]